MITLSPSSLCDVCAEEYGPHNYPHCIPCGHVLCLSCCNSIIHKKNPKYAPACPFCRETFSSDSVRMIRIDFTPSGSGWSTPRQCLVGVYDNVVDDTEDDVLFTGLKMRTDAKVLESKVARIAAKKCSVEEVTALHKELQDWLTTDSKRSEKTMSLHLSALLLRAILMNHLAHSEATKTARNLEYQLRDQLEQAEAAKAKAEADLRSLRSQFSQTAQDCQNLRAELSRYKSSGGYASPSRPQSVSSSSPTPPSRSRATSPSSPTPYQQPHTPAPSVRMSSTTSTPARSPSVAPQARSTPTVPVSHRTMTPSIRSGVYTPSPISRSESARPSTPAKIRTTSISGHITTPTKMMRSMSSESSSDEIQTQKDAAKREARLIPIQRWIPPPDSASPPANRPSFLSSLGRTHIPSPQVSSPGRPRAVSNASGAFAPPLRYKTPIPVNSS